MRKTLGGWMLPTNRFEPVPLVDGGRLVVSVSQEAGIVISRNSARGESLGLIRVPYPRHGFAGGGTVLPASQRFAVVDYYSGQSEQTFMLLDLSEGLRLVASPPYLLGEYASYAFSEDDGLLLMALPVASDAWWTDPGEQHLTLDEDGTAYLPFATLTTCDSGSGQLVRSSVVIVPGLDKALPSTWDDPDLNPRFLDAATVCLSMPWGDAAISLPTGPSTIRVHYQPAGPVSRPPATA